jgi:hypothetical protein
MRERPSTLYHPDLEPLDAKLLLSAGLVSRPAAHGLVTSAVRGKSEPGGVQDVAKKPSTGFLVYRITNPNRFNNTLAPPFSQRLVQSRQPIPGEIYNVLYVVVRNGTAQTFDASSGFRVKIPQSGESFPILTGSQQWKPGERLVFYILTKKYYPLPSQVHSGFEFDLGGARSVAIPGPSGIFLRITYNPATFARILDWIVAHGPGVQGGKGAKYGLPDTATYEFVSAQTRRIDFGGYF